MNKKILEAFAKEIHKRNSWSRTLPNYLTESAKKDIELVSKIASQFNPRFDKKRFITQCLKED